MSLFCKKKKKLKNKSRVVFFLRKIMVPLRGTKKIFFKSHNSTTTCRNEKRFSAFYSPSNRVFSRDVTKFNIFPRKLPAPCWCPFAAYKVSWIYGHLHYKRCLRRKMTLPNCLNMQIHLILLLRKGICRK